MSSFAHAIVGHPIKRLSYGGYDWYTTEADGGNSTLGTYAERAAFATGGLFIADSNLFFSIFGAPVPFNPVLLKLLDPTLVDALIPEGLAVADYFGNDIHLLININIDGTINFFNVYGNETSPNIGMLYYAQEGTPIGGGTSTPEPSSLALMGAGLLSMAYVSRRHRRVG